MGVHPESSDPTPMETDIVTLYATAHNVGYLPAEDVIVGFFAGDPQADGVYLGSAYLPSISSGGTAQASLQWDTTGYSGYLEIYAILDAAGQMVEMDEDNNTAVLPVSVLARPDLLVAGVEQLGSARQFMYVDISTQVHNGGGTDAPVQTVALYDGDPANGGQLIDSQTIAVGAGLTETVTFSWRPDSLGPKTLFVQADAGDDEEGRQAAAAGRYTLEYDAARKIAQGLGAHLERLETLVEVKGDKARLRTVSERAHALFGKQEDELLGKRKSKAAPQLSLFSTLDEVEAQASGWVEQSAPPAGASLDRLHQAMLLFVTGRGEALKRFLVEDGAGKDQRLWRLAQALSALYPSGSDEKRWVDGVLARKKGLGF